MKLIHKRICILSTLFCLNAIYSFALLPSTSHSCYSMALNSLTYRFTVPVGTSPNIGSVRIYFNISDSSSSLSYSNVAIDPPGTGLQYGPFTVSGYDTAHDVASPNGYRVYLHNKGTNSFALEIVNLPEGSGYWDTSDSSLSPVYWEITVSGMGTSDPYDLNLTDIRAYAVGVTDESSFISPAPSGLYFTYVSVCNQKPLTGAINAGPDETTPLKVNFDAPDATDPDGSVDAYQWDFDIDHPGTKTGTGCPTSYTYSIDGTYHVSLKVQDNNGAWSDLATATVDTNQRPNLAGISVAISTTAAMEVTLSAVFPLSPTPQDPDSGDTIATYIWDFGDGSAYDEDSHSSITHPYTADGDKTVWLWVKDNHGLSSDSNTSTPEADPVTLTVNPNAAPVVDISATAVAPSTITTSGNDIYGAAPMLLSVAPNVISNDDTMSGYDWTLDGSSFSTSTLEFNDIGVHSINLIGRDSYTIPSAAATRTVYVLPNELMHFARALGVPYDSQVSPFVDGILVGLDGQAEPAGQPDAGVVYGENGWRGAYQQVYGSSTAGSDLIFQGIQDNSANVLYFSFEVTYDYSLDSDDQIILGFRGDSDDPSVANSAGDRLVSIDMGLAPLGVAGSAGIQVFKRGAGATDGWSVAASCPAGLKCAK